MSLLTERYYELKPRTTGVSPWVKAFLSDRQVGIVLSVWGIPRGYVPLDQGRG